MVFSVLIILRVVNLKPLKKMVFYLCWGQLASSDLKNDRLFQHFKQMPNIEFKNIENEKIVALKGDETQLVIAIIQYDSKDPLNDCTGFGTNYPPLITLLSPIVNLLWNTPVSF